MSAQSEAATNEPNTNDAIRQKYKALPEKHAGSNNNFK